MKNSATTLRALVSDNALELGRLTADQLGSTEDYKELTSLYRNGLDALTSWASKDYAHKATTEDSDLAFEACKAILSIFATEDSRIIIDLASMRTLRDMSTQPKRMYSEEYKKAMKLLKETKKQIADREEDLAILGIELPTEEEKNNLEAWADAIPADVNRIIEGIDRVKAYVGINATYKTRLAKVEDIKSKGGWTWTRPVAVADNKFAELVENYVADCLDSGYNIKTSKTVRDEKAEARKAALEAKKQSK